MERIIVELNNSNIFDRILYLENEEQIVLTTFPEINNHSHRCNDHFLFPFFSLLSSKRNVKHCSSLVQSHNQQSQLTSKKWKPSRSTRAIVEIAPHRRYSTRKMEQGRSRRRGSRDKATEKPESVTILVERRWSTVPSGASSSLRQGAPPPLSLFLSLVHSIS